MSWQDAYRSKKRSAEEAMSVLQSGMRVFLSGNAGAPQVLQEAMCQRAQQAELQDVEVAALLTMGDAPYDQPEHRAAFRPNALFVGANLREAVNAGRADYTPIFLSEIPRLFRRQMPLDVALIQVSPPDEHGFCSLGVSVDIVKGAAQKARFLIAEVNARTPRTLGDSFVHVSRLSAVVEADYALPVHATAGLDDVTRTIGENVASLIDDGDTLQLGIGAIPDAVLASCGDKQDLGIHTEMFSDGVMHLFEQGVVTGERKPLHRGKIVTSFLMGSQALYDWVDNNPVVEMHPSDYTNDPFLIAQHDHMVAVNSAISVDLTGQVNSDSIGRRFYSGIGGQVDFIRGAARAEHGRPVIALPATARRGTVSRIVTELAPAAGVVTSRGDVHYVVTEFGVAHLWGRSVRERTEALIGVAHPDFRDELRSQAQERKLL